MLSSYYKIASIFAAVVKVAIITAAFIKLLSLQLYKINIFITFINENRQTKKGYKDVTNGDRPKGRSRIANIIVVFIKLLITLHSVKLMLYFRTCLNIVQMTQPISSTLPSNGWRIQMMTTWLLSSRTSADRG